MIPPRTILTGVDFSDGSRSALEFAARLALQCGSSLHVLHAEHPLLAAAARHLERPLSDETLDELRHTVTETWPAASCSPQLHVATGEAPRTILSTGAREHADLIVVGSHGMSGAERVFFGSTAEYVLRWADVSVAVVPARWTRPRTDLNLAGMGPIVAAIDFSESSVLAAGAAIWLAEQLDTSAELVHVVPTLPALRRWQPHAETATRARVESARSELNAVVRGLGQSVSIQSRVEVGGVPDTLAAAVRPFEGRHPILVLGRSAGGSRGQIPGAVAFQVLMRAEVPVIVYLPRP